MRVLTSKEIFFPDAKDEPIPIQAKNLINPWKNLGHFKSPRGNSKTQLTAISKKAIEISKAISKPKQPEIEPKCCMNQSIGLQLSAP